MKGMRMRAMDKFQTKYYEQWGGNSVVVPWPEVYNALQTGIADGYVNPSWVPIMFKHTELLKYYTNAAMSPSLRIALASEEWYSGLSKKDKDVVITDGGINLLGWERPLSEFIPIINLTRPSLKERPLRIFGSLCTPLDIWGSSIFGEGAFPGDILLVPNQGAYTYSLRQSFIKPIARVIHYNGSSLSEAEPETSNSASGQR